MFKFWQHLIPIQTKNKEFSYLNHFHDKCDTKCIMRIDLTIFVFINLLLTIQIEKWLILSYNYTNLDINICYIVYISIYYIKEFRPIDHLHS